ncbi:hypothetical protein T4D_5408 [Trichinella pseudospiralis]|uniref:Uncharacterized protein n=1 Tax=Trichinella pseudospiralis TaxID=6337 RepID=A0A0V1FVY0_TRIPS|nr:hypothetical protein T4D_5408 [Trichinella pseudospiralis]
MDFNVKSWNQKIVYGRARSRYKTGTGTATQVQALNYLAKNVQAADMVVYVQNNLWSSLQSTLPPPCQIKFLWSLVADVYIFVPITMEMDYIEFDMLNTFRHLYKPKNPQATPPGVAQRLKKFAYANFSIA